jgi:hypothetical protein
MLSGPWCIANAGGIGGTSEAHWPLGEEEQRSKKRSDNKTIQDALEKPKAKANKEASHDTSAGAGTARCRSSINCGLATTPSVPMSG